MEFVCKSTVDQRQDALLTIETSNSIRRNNGAHPGYHAQFNWYLQQATH